MQSLENILFYCFPYLVFLAILPQLAKQSQEYVGGTLFSCKKPVD